MIPLLLSLTFGGGVACLYFGLTAPPPLAGESVSRPRSSPLTRIRGLLASPELRDFLIRAGLPGVSPRDFALFAIGTGVASAVATHVLIGWGVVTAGAFLLGLAAPVAYYGRRHERRRAALQAALVEAIAELRDAIRIGLAVPEAFVALARTGPEVLRPELGGLVAEMRLRGFPEALTRLRDRLADPLFDVVCASLLLNDELGGRHLSQVLDRLVEAVRSELRVQEDLRAQQARNVLSARIVAAIPLVLLLAVRALNPRYVAVFDAWPGPLLLAGCATSVALGYAAMRWMTRLPGDRRVLV